MSIKNTPVLINGYVKLLTEILLDIMSQYPQQSVNCRNKAMRNCGEEKHGIDLYLGIAEITDLPGIHTI